MDTNAMMSVKLKTLLLKVNKLNDQMYDQLYKFVKANNGFIRTDNIERETLGKKVCDNIYMIAMLGDDEPNTEHRVLAVAILRGQLSVLPALAESSTSRETISGLTDNEVMTASYWETIKGGYVLETATLCNLCESIGQYV